MGIAKAENERLIMNDRRRRFILLDRDGVINRRHANGVAKGWETFEFLPRSLEALRLLAANDYTGIVISRQSCETDGVRTASELDAITRRFLLEVALSQGHIAEVYYCRHRQADGCNCYKPSVGLIARAKSDYGFRLEETHFISESDSDLALAAAAGCSTIRIQRDAFLWPGPHAEAFPMVASNLYEAAEQIVARAQVQQHLYAAVHA
ncbi:MAG: HAD-IIIA family hydrolase [Candidatus Acidiferrum sp.]